MALLKCAPTIDSVRVLFLTYSLGIGGAERILVSLACELQKYGHKVSVLNIGRDSFFQDELSANGVQTVSPFSAGCRGERAFETVRVLWSFRIIFKIVKSFRPDIIQSWLYPADLVAGFTGKILGVPVVWGVFSGHVSFKFYSASMYALIRMCGTLSSYLSRAIISCSAFGRRTHVGIGYPRTKFLYIPTGFEIAPTQNRESRNHHSDAVTIGMLARWTIEKRHDRLIQAVADQIAIGQNVKLVLAGGRGVDARNPSLFQCLVDTEVIKDTELLGAIDDVEEFWNRIEIFCLFSDSEGLPTVIGEAMAHALPCLVSDVGDSRVLLADSDQICDLNNPSEIRQKLSRLVGMTLSARDVIGQRNRRRIQSHFSTEKMAQRYETAYKAIVDGW